MALTNTYKKSSGEVSHQTQCTMHLTEAKEVENGWKKINTGGLSERNAS